MNLDDLGLTGKNIPEVYVDMDGVLADFFGAWAKLDGKDHYKDIDNPEAKLQLVREHPNFWLDLPVLPNAGRLLGFIKKYIGTYKICSSPLAGDPNSEPHKRIWVKKHLFAFPPSDVIITSNKAAYALQANGTANILIDDFGKNIKKWTDAGGIGIKHKDYKLERTFNDLRSVFPHLASSVKVLDQK